MSKDIKSISWNDQTIAYSTKVQKEMVRQLKKANGLRVYIIMMLAVFTIMLALIFFNTGTLGSLARRAVC